MLGCCFRTVVLHHKECGLQLYVRISPQFDLMPNSMLTVINQAQAADFIQLPK